MHIGGLQAHKYNHSQGVQSKINLELNKVVVDVFHIDVYSIVHALSSFNLYEDVIREPEDECDDLSDAISDPTTQ